MSRAATTASLKFFSRTCMSHSANVGFGLVEEVDVGARGRPQRLQRPLPVSTPEDPLSAPWHSRVHDVIDPGAGDARTHVARDPA